MTQPNTPSPLPTFREIADMRVQEARFGTRTINLKVAINTARMMVEAEDKRERHFRSLLELAKMWAARDDGGSARALLREIENGR